MTSNPLEVVKKRALTSMGFNYQAAHVGWAKIKTKAFHSMIEWFNTQVFTFLKNSKKVFFAPLKNKKNYPLSKDIYYRGKKNFPSKIWRLFTFTFCRHFKSKNEGIDLLQVLSIRIWGQLHSAGTSNQNLRVFIYFLRVFTEGNDSIFLRRSFFPYILRAFHTTVYICRYVYVFRDWY